MTAINYPDLHLASQDDELPRGHPTTLKLKPPEEETKLSAGVILDTSDQKGWRGDKTVSLIFRPSMGRVLHGHSAVVSAMIDIERDVLSNAARSLDPFLSLSLPERELRKKIWERLIVLAVRDYSGSNFVDWFRTGMTMYFPKERESLPVLFTLGLPEMPNFLFYYQLGVENPWRSFGLFGDSFVYRGEFEQIALTNKEQMFKVAHVMYSPERVMWLTRWKPDVLMYSENLPLNSNAVLFEEKKEETK